jgi:transcriptional regulator with XRE-family HTH domain
LKRRRLEKGWSLADLAERSGLSRQTLSLLERGQRQPRPANISLLAKVLECSTTELLEPETA